MSDEEDEDRRRRAAEALLRLAATSQDLSDEQRLFMAVSADRIHDGLALGWMDRMRVRILLGTVAIP